MLQSYDENGNPNDQGFYLTDMSQGLYDAGGIDDYQQPSEDEFFIDPPMPVLLSTFMLGKEYSYSHTDGKMGVGTWTVMIEDDPVTVPAGTYNDCYKSTVIRQYGEIQGTFIEWYCKNIGLVKRVELAPPGSANTWELTLYTP